jgi:ppGpp synthetase/RelA/SpoT-type nucleotidyltranferase
MNNQSQVPAFSETLHRSADLSQGSLSDAAAHLALDNGHQTETHHVETQNTSPVMPTHTPDPASQLKFKAILKEFEDRFDERSTQIEKGLNKVKNLVEELGVALDKEGVKIQSITSRLKEKNSAIESLKRRQRERNKRAQYRDEMEELGQSWEDYWEANNRERIDDYGWFPDMEALFKGLHDIGGMRLTVYFPNDVEKVVERLKSLEGIVFERQFQRGQDAAPDMFMLESHIANLRKDKNTPHTGVPTSAAFAGYRATHVHVRPDTGCEHVIEIQIQTVVMHAWSQVEHGIVYKPKHVGNEKTSHDKKMILDTVNGIVLAGENALRQLGEVLAREQDQKAENLYELGTWITEHWRFLKKESPLKYPTQQYNHLEKLYEYLISGDEHTHGVIKALVEQVLEADTEGIMPGCDLPLFMLSKMCISQATKSPVQQDYHHLPEEDRSFAAARSLALRVVHCLNVAAALDIRKDFTEIMDKKVLPPMDTRPTLLDFLDVLHPDQSRVDWTSMSRLCQFCRAFLDMEKFCEVVAQKVRHRSGETSEKALAELPRWIVESGRIAFPIFGPDNDRDEHSAEDAVIIPRTLCILLKDHDNTHWIPDIYSVAKVWKDIDTPDIFGAGPQRTLFAQGTRRLDVRASESVDIIFASSERNQPKIKLLNGLQEQHTRSNKEDRISSKQERF